MRRKRPLNAGWSTLPVGTHERAMLLTAGVVVALLAVLAGLIAQPATPATIFYVPHAKHVVVIVFENHERGDVIGSDTAPEFNALAASYAQASNYHALTHPSFPNYLAMVSGSMHGITSDCDPRACPQTGATIGSQLTRARRRWGAYGEDFPSGREFAAKHEPFLYFSDTARFVHPLTALNPAYLPAFALVTPNLCHDMHDCSVHTGDTWLKAFIKPFLSRSSTIVFVAFDEGESVEGGGGLVPLVVAGRLVKRHTITRQPLDHYSLLRTIESALGLPPLGRAASATPITGIWRQ